jgi:uncharacterized membrane protein YoaK (UPF0700 family)
MSGPAAHADPAPERSSRGVRALIGATLWAGPEHGPLPAVLLVLTALTGVVDAVSILRLGRVFVANMTGNVVFVGFALAGAPGFSLSASLFALAGFLAGARLAGVLNDRSGRDRAVLLRSGAAIEVVLVATALVVSASVATPLGTASVDVLAATLAVAMGVQNAVARRLAVPDLTTSVLTMTLTGIAADRGARQREAAFVRRVLAVATTLAGAVAGAELVLHTSTTAALGLALGLLAVVVAGALLAARRPGPWRAG